MLKLSIPTQTSDAGGAGRLSLAAIRRWRLLVVACSGLLLLACLAWNHIPRSEDPIIEPPEAGVFIPYPGASSADVEAQIVRVVEESLYGMERLEYIEASATPGLAFFHLKFEDDTPMDVFAERIRGRIQSKRNELPPQIKEPTVSKYSTATFTTQMVIAVAGNRSDMVLTENAKRLKKDLAAVPGVASCELRGGAQKSLRVRLDATKLAEHGIAIEQVVRSLQSANLRLPAGELGVGSRQAVLEPNQALTSAADVRAVPVGVSNDPGGHAQAITLGQVAEVTDSPAPLLQRFMHRGRPAVAVEVRVRAGDDAVKVGARVRERLAQLRPQLDELVLAEIAHDQPAWVAHTIDDFTTSLLEGVALVMLVLTLGLGWRAGLVVSIAIPLASAGAIIGLYLFGFGLDKISIAGLIVALGLLVDDAVVVVESVQLMRNHGLGAVRAAMLGTARVFGANNGTTAVACAAFFPLFFMGGDVGSFLRGLPTGVVIALLTSLLVAQFVTPWLSALVLRPQTKVIPIPDHEPYDCSDDGAERGEGESNPALRWLKEYYVRNVGWVVRHPFAVIGAATVMLVGAAALLPQIGVQFFPKAAKPVLFVHVEAPRGTQADATAELVAQVVRQVEREPAVVETSAIIGASYPQIFVSRAPRLARQDFGEVLVRTREQASTAEVARRLRSSLADIAGANISVEEIYTGPGLEHPITVRLFGDDYAKLRAYADEVKSKLRAEAGTLNVTDSLTDAIPVASLAIDRDRALAVGLTPAMVGSSLRWLYGNDKLTELHHDGETIAVQLEPPAWDPRPLEQVASTPVINMAGRPIPVGSVSTPSVGASFAELKRRNTRRIVEVTADVAGDTLPSTVVASLDPWLHAKQWAPGYGFSYAGEEEQTDRSFRNLALAGLGALIVIFALLVLMFDSFGLAAAVILAVPYAFIGALAGLATMGEPFGFMAFLGLIALIGVYVNHKIYFTDRFVELTRRGVPLLEALQGAGTDRIRPVVLTALTAILGLIPLTLSGGAMWAGYGWVNIFGLLASIPLSLVVLPALLVVVSRARAPADVTEPALQSTPASAPFGKRAQA